MRGRLYGLQYSEQYVRRDEQLRGEPSEPLLTAGQVAELLAVPRSSVCEYARRQHGALPSIPVGRHCRFYRSDLGAWLAGQRAGQQ